MALANARRFESIPLVSSVRRCGRQAQSAGGALDVGIAAVALAAWCWRRVALVPVPFRIKAGELRPQQQAGVFTNDGIVAE